MAQKTTKKYRWKDLDLDFIPHPATNDIAKKYDAEAIKRSIRSLVQTRFYERLFQPDIGTNVQDLLFDLATPSTASIIQRQIEDVIINFEKRAQLIEVEVVADNMGRSYTINITFLIINQPEPIQFQFILERTR